MLPSMPLLMTPVRELCDDSSDTSDDSPFVHQVAENGHIPTNNTVEGAAENGEPDQLLTLNSCPAESSSNVIVQPEINKVSNKPTTPEKRISSDPSSAQKKKKKTQHKKTLAALTPDSRACLESTAQNFAETYFQKVRCQLGSEKWTQFVQELVNFEEKNEKQPTELYLKMEEFLSPHTELIDEFLGFLLPHQALQVNRLIPYLLLVKMKEFFRKLNILLMKKQARQVYTALESLASQSNLTLADVKATILPLLKSSPLLTNHFLELLPGERPPDSLMTDFEQVDFKNDSLFETIIVPDCPDPYGNENCICSCHKIQNKHCISCGIKYLNGRVYLQHGKVLRPAKVTFTGDKHPDLRKWEKEKCHSRRRLLPKTMLSPNCLDHRLNVDSEDDCGVKKSPRTPRIRTARPKVSKKAASCSKEEEVLEGIFPLVEPKSVIIEENIMGEVVVVCETIHNGNEEHEFEEVVMENECNTEEEEEEDLNKCLNYENDSSLEDEDVAKEAKELVSACSLESQIQSSDDSMVKSGLIKTESITEDNIENMVITYEHINSPVKMELESSSNITNEQLPVTSCHQTNTRNNYDTKEKLVSSQIVVVDNIEENTNPSCNIKMEKSSVDKIEMMSVTYEECCSTMKQEPCNVTQHKESVSDSDNMDIGENGTQVVDSLCKEWTREEDKIILQTFQHENGLEQTFETASLQLPNRSKEEIQERFEVLLKLLKEMISDESNSNP